MKLLFTHEMHAIEYKGKYYNPHILSYENMLNYLHLMPEGILVARCKGSVDRLPPDAMPLEGERIKVVPIPDIRSPVSLVKKFLAVHRALKPAISEADRYVVRMPGVCGMAVAFSLILRRKKYGVEFVGHPTESVAEVLKREGKSSKVLLSLLSFVNSFIVKRSAVVGYRSEYLKREFPSGHGDRDAVFSGAQLKKEFISSPRGVEHFEKKPFVVASIGRTNPEKGHRTLLEAFLIAQKASDVPMKLRVIGDGTCLEDLRRSVVEAGAEGSAEFLGRVDWGTGLFQLLDDAHLFVIPSLTEGMPRSLIEAMARGMPALGSDCGGIPELLDKESLVPPGDAKALAEKILALSRDPARLAGMSARNFEASKEHWPENLARSKDKFWKNVAEYGK